MAATIKKQVDRFTENCGLWSLPPLNSWHQLTGDTCADDFDGCADNPCTAGTNCTDLTPTEQVAQGKTFVCTGCPDGFEKDAGICVGRWSADWNDSHM